MTPARRSTATKDDDVTWSAADFLPNRISIKAMRAAAENCRGCPLYKCGNVVFSEGPARSPIMFVGEQPGDHEERQQRPFVGPAGRLFDEALEAAGIERGEVYVTNAVKHFKHETRGIRRIHKTPKDEEVAACYPWLDEEITSIKPRIIVVLGATAAQALLGKDFRVTQKRGVVVESSFAAIVMATVHPSSVLRAQPGERAESKQAFFDDIKAIAAELARVKSEDTETSEAEPDAPEE